MNNYMYSGTPIQSLQQRAPQYNSGIQQTAPGYGQGQMQYNAFQNLQAEQSHGAAHQSQQSQQDPYYNIRTPEEYPQWLPKNSNATQNMEELARDISDNLPEDEDEEQPISKSKHEESFDDSESGFISNIPVQFRDPILIFVIFVILSQPFLKRNIGQYIKQINPSSETGEVAMTGIVIYGLIFALCFWAIKRFLIK